MKIDDIDRVGNRIKDIRKKKSLTITELAKYTDLSVGYLSNIERNQTSPTLRNLSTICSALNISLRDIITEDADERVVIRKEEGVVREYPEYHMTIRFIDFGDDNGEYQIATMKPGKTQKVAEGMHPYQEIGMVLQGELNIEVDGTKYVLNKEIPSALSRIIFIPCKIWEKRTVSACGMFAVRWDGIKYKDTFIQTWYQ